MSFINKIRAYANNQEYENYSEGDNYSSSQEVQVPIQIPRQSQLVEQQYKTNSASSPNDMFDVIRDHFYPKMLKERLLLAGFAAIAAVGTFYPVFNPNQPKISKTIELGYGVIAGICLSAGLYFRKGEETRYRMVENARNALTTQSLKYEVAYEGTVEQINSTRRIVAFIKTKPPEEWPYWINYYGVQGLVELPVQQQVAVVEPANAPQKQFILPNQTSFADMSNGVGYQVDYSWIDEIVCSSKAVIGEKNTGKSLFLSYLACLFLTVCPEGELRIIDPHFDEDDDGKWLPGIPLEHLMKHYVTKYDGIDVFRTAGKLLKQRIKEGIKLQKVVNGVKVKNPNCQPFHVMCDEFDAFFPALSEPQQNEVLTIIKEIEYEGRKYGVNTTLGLHTMKKEITGVDSSVLFQMDLVIMGRILADTNNKVPVDFDRKLLLTNQEVIQSMLKPGQGRACTFRKLNEPPCTRVIPHIDLSKPIFSIETETFENMEEVEQVSQETRQETRNDVSTQNQESVQQQELLWIDEMKQWLNLLGAKPTSKQVQQKYQAITGNQINLEQVKVLMNYLEIEAEAE